MQCSKAFRRSVRDNGDMENVRDKPEIVRDNIKSDIKTLKDFGYSLKG